MERAAVLVGDEAVGVHRLAFLMDTIK